MSRLREATPAAGRIGRIIELAEREMFFSLVFVKEGSRGFAQKKHQTLRLYTLTLLTELKKRLYGL